MYSIANNTKPAILTRTESRIQSQRDKRTRDTEARRAKYRRNAARYLAASFWQGSRNIADFFKGRGFDHATLQDAENDCMDNVDFSYLYSRDYARELEKEYGDDARELFAYLCPDAPLSVYREQIADDMVRAVADSQRADYALQFFDWCRDAVEDAAESSGLVWCYLDKAGKPTDQEYDAHAVGFACSRRAYLNCNAEWWPITHWRGHGEPHDAWNDYGTNSERMDAADDVLSDYLREHLESEGADLESFDERGSRYADDDYWPEYFSDYSEAREQWENDKAKMRARLREMIANRAPLELRAALVASVYGEPGRAADESED